MTFLHRHKAAFSNLGLIAILLFGAAYLVIDVMRINPLRGAFHITVNMERSGGLQTNADVTLRGFRVGKITHIGLSDTGVVATAEINDTAQIPVDSVVAVRALSAAGEQYLDFRPATDAPPYLRDGDDITGRDRVSTPTPVSDVLVSSAAMFDQFDPTKLGTVVTELDKALAGGPDQLRSLVNGLSLITVGLDGLLPQTTNLLANLRVIAGTTALAQPDLATLTRNSQVIFKAADAADGELRRFFDQGPGQLSTLQGVLAQNKDPLTNVVQKFVGITRAAQLRTPALRALFPSLRDGVKALGVPAHDGAFNTVVDIWQRPFCEYSSPRISPSIIANEGRVRLWNYCETNNPSLQVRGSANAPRPNVPNNGAHIPPGVNPNEMSTPLPEPWTW